METPKNYGGLSVLRYQWRSRGNPNDINSDLIIGMRLGGRDETHVLCNSEEELCMAALVISEFEFNVKYYLITRCK